jgi:hypothetical protein
MALSRHLQQASIETDTSRQSGQVRWPQSKHLILKRGHSGRLLICDPAILVSLLQSVSLSDITVGRLAFTPLI